ncbi:MAG: ABC transporter substrate-binding protein [Thermodesulfobacteriota bacterium]
MRRPAIIFCLWILIFIPINGWTKNDKLHIGMAVEFNDHAASAYVCKEKGWFKKEGLSITSYESYVTGTALASALARGDIQVAFICLVPVINAYANAKVPIKIVAGTHKYGFGLVVNPEKIKDIRELERPEIHIGCVQVGTPSDAFLNKVIDKYNLGNEILNRIQRMNPPQQLLAIKMGKIDAGFLPEHWATMAEEYGFKMIQIARDVWPEMQGSVLVVKEDLIQRNPEIVGKIVKVTKEATHWINRHPEDAAEIMSKQLQITGEKVFPLEAAKLAAKLEIDSKILLRSMNRLEYSMSIDPKVIQETIDYVAGKGYIKNRFRAEEILDLRFLIK